MSTTKLDVPLEEEKLTDDDLKRHRVGGRLVTRREIIRSKKCTSRQLEVAAQIDVPYSP